MNKIQGGHICNIVDAKHRRNPKEEEELYFEGTKKPNKTGSDRLRFVANANGPGTVNQHSEDGRGV